MADPATAADASSDRRDRRSERKRRRLKRIAAIAAAIALVAVFALVATDAVRFGVGDKPSLAGTPASGPRPAAATVTTTKTTESRCRALSTTDPLRLWVGGDSLAGSLGPSLGAIAGATGVVQPYFDSRVSSGLSSPGFFDWPTHATVEMATINPEIVAFIIGANDWGSVSGEKWKTAYADEVDGMMKTLIGPGRTVYWIGSPTLKDDKMDAAVAEVNAVTAEVATRHPEVHYIDAHKMFSDADGTFAFDLPDENGKVVTMRAGDGVHLTMDGADYLARAVYKFVDDECRVSAQKVDGAAKRTIESPGSTQVAPGSTGSSGSSSGSSGGSIATTPPATAPPTTSPPTTLPPVTEPPTTAAPTTTSLPGGTTTP